MPRMRHMEEWLRQKSDRLVHQRQGIGLSYVRLWLEEGTMQGTQAPLPVSQPKARGLNPDLKFVADIPLVPTRPRLRLELLASAVMVQPWRFTGETRTATVPGRVMWTFDQVQYPATEGALASVIHILLSLDIFCSPGTERCDSAAQIARSGQDHRGFKFRALHRDGKSVPGRNRTRPVGFLLRVICGMVCSGLRVWYIEPQLAA